jgi:hypothetical protein
MASLLSSFFDILVEISLTNLLFKSDFNPLDHIKLERSQPFKILYKNMGIRSSQCFLISLSIPLISLLFLQLFIFSLFCCIIERAGKLSCSLALSLAGVASKKKKFFFSLSWVGSLVSSPFFL